MSVCLKIATAYGQDDFRGQRPWNTQLAHTQNELGSNEKNGFRFFSFLTLQFVFTCRDFGSSLYIPIYVYNFYTYRAVFYY